MEIFIDKLIERLSDLKKTIYYENKIKINEMKLNENEIFKNRMEYILFYINHLFTELDELIYEIESNDIYNEEYKLKKIQEYNNIKNSMSKIFSIYNYIEQYGETCID